MMESKLGDEVDDDKKNSFDNYKVFTRVYGSKPMSHKNIKPWVKSSHLFTNKGKTNHTHNIVKIVINKTWAMV